MSEPRYTRLSLRGWVMLLALCGTQCQLVLGIRDREVESFAPTSGGTAGVATTTQTGAGASSGSGNISAQGGQASLAGASNVAGSAGNEAGGASSEGGSPSAGGNGNEAGTIAEGGAGGETTDPPKCDPLGKFGTPERLKLSTVRLEQGLRLSSNGLVGYFASDEGGGDEFHDLPGFDLFVTTRESLDEPFEAFVKLDKLSISPDKGELSPTETADGLTLYFDAYRPYRHLWRAWRKHRDDDYLNQDQEELKALSSGAEDFDPYVTPDGTALYFTSSRSSATSVYGFNLFVAQLTNGKVTDQTEVPGVNLSFEGERHAVVSPDQTIIYFARNSKAQEGIQHIFRATRKSTAEPFGDEAEVTELSTSASQFPNFISPDLCTLYFTSNGQGSEDLYVARREPAP